MRTVVNDLSTVRNGNAILFVTNQDANSFPSEYFGRRLHFQFGRTVYASYQIRHEVPRQSAPYLRRYGDVFCANASDFKTPFTPSEIDRRS